MNEQDTIQRTVLPIPDRPRTGLVTYDAKDPETKFPPITQLRPPKGSPNVLIVLIDDAGFGSSSAFGGPCNTPTAELLAAGGLKYNRFHTTALCSPTRQAMLTGRNHHTVGMGGITEIATGSPGYNSVLPNTCAPIARTLKLNGYATAQFGKCHEVPVWETSPAGPFAGAPPCLPQGEYRGEPRQGPVDHHRSPSARAISCLLQRRRRHPFDELRANVGSRPLHAGGQAVPAHGRGLLPQAVCREGGPRCE